MLSRKSEQKDWKKFYFSTRDSKRYTFKILILSAGFRRYIQLNGGNYYGPGKMYEMQREC